MDVDYCWTNYVYEQQLTVELHEDCQSIWQLQIQQEQLYIFLTVVDCQYHFFPL